MRVRLLTCTGEKHKNLIPKGAGGLPQFFFLTLNLILFVSINSVQNFKTVALPLLGEKFVVVVVVGGWWLTVILVFCFGPNLFLALQDLNLDRAEQF